jgi:hypothetical protein
LYCVTTAEAFTASRDVIYRLKEKFLHDGEDMYRFAEGGFILT